MMVQVYSKLKGVNDSLEAVGWPTHVLRNAFQTAFDVLSIDTEVIVMGFYSGLIYIF